MTIARQGLLGRVLVRLVGGGALMAALFFGTAGTFDYWQAWLFLLVLLTPMVFALIYFLRHDPDLLERRIRSREQRAEQKGFVGAAGLVLVLAFVIPGLDQRFGWSTVAPAISIAADGVVLLGYGLLFVVMRANTFAARTIAVEAGQRIVTTGPYGVVRHPMYLAAAVLYLACPVALGSWWAVVPALLLPPLLGLRIRDEERMLEVELNGYREYQTKTRYRLFPGVW